MKKVFKVTQKDLQKPASELLLELVPKAESQGVFVALHGDLGAGKTAFVKEVAKLLGVEEEIISPTFILKKEYVVPLREVEKLIHIDAYRLNSAKEGRVLRLENDDIPKTITFVEWGEKLEKRAWDAELSFEYISEEVRGVEVVIHEK